MEPLEESPGMVGSDRVMLKHLGERTGAGRIFGLGYLTGLRINKENNKESEKYFDSCHHGFFPGTSSMSGIIEFPIIYLKNFYCLKKKKILCNRIYLFSGLPCFQGFHNVQEIFTSAFIFTINGGY